MLVNKIKSGTSTGEVLVVGFLNNVGDEIITSKGDLKQPKLLSASANDQFWFKIHFFIPNQYVGTQQLEEENSRRTEDSIRKKKCFVKAFICPLKGG